MFGNYERFFCFDYFGKSKFSTYICNDNVLKPYIPNIDIHKCVNNYINIITTQYNYQLLSVARFFNVFFLSRDIISKREREKERERVLAMTLCRYY